MIYTHISGGLGNQLFQYAAGKALALHHGMPLRLDVSYFAHDELRKFELDNFNINVDIANAAEVAYYKNRPLAQRVAQRLFLPPYKRVPFKQPHFQYYKEFFKAPAICYLKGTWQSEKYFWPVRKEIRNELVLKPSLTMHLRDKAIELGSRHCVAVHIRRGDYLKPEIFKFHGVLSGEYYNKALEIVMKKWPGCKACFFSDDIAWVKKNIHTTYDSEFISGHVSHNHYEDFYLMQHCRHNIVANSSFSWWCAWLNKYDNKTVVAPAKWFNKVNYNTKDLAPSGWIKI